MRTRLLIILLLLPMFAYATVYKWVDKEGKVHYSDTPIENAQAVEFKSNTQNNIKLPPPVVLPKHSQSQTQTKQEGYQLNIISPAEEETLRDNNGNITLSVNISPDLANSHQLLLLMDGKVIGPPQRSSIFHLENIDRGEHIFKVQVITQNGKQLALTPPRTVFLHRAIINSAVKPAITGQ